MNAMELIVALLGSAGFVAGVAGILKAVLDHRRGVRGDEGAAEERHIARLEKRIQTLEEALEKSNREWNDLLREYGVLVQQNQGTERYLALILAKYVSATGNTPPERF